MTGRWLSIALLVIPVISLSACGTRSVLKPTANPETSYKLITPPDASHYTLQPGQSASLPAPVIGHFTPPAYPASLAHPGMPPVVVKAQLVFGSDGKVQEVVILADSYAGAAHALFEDAVRMAARNWAFTPLVFEECTGDGSAPVKLERNAKPFSLWFEFSFGMADGKPIVETVKR